MNKSAWQRVLDKYSENIGPGKPVIVVLKTARDHVSGTIKELDEEFLILGDESGNGISAIIAIEDIAGLRTK